MYDSDGSEEEGTMDRTQLVTIVAAILAKGNSEPDLVTAAKSAERLVQLIELEKNERTSKYTGKLPTV